MNHTYQEPVEVVVRFDKYGSISLISFTWQSRTYHIDSIGRRWQDADRQQHFMVMAQGNRTFELLFKPATLRWFLCKIGPPVA